MKRTGGSSGNLLDLSTMDDSQEQRQEDNEGGDADTPLLPAATTGSSLSTPQYHAKRASFLDQFPSIDDHEDNPLTLDEDDHVGNPTNSNDLTEPLLGEQQARDNAANDTSQEDLHPLLRQRHTSALANNAATKPSSQLASKLRIPQNPSPSLQEQEQQGSPHHHKTKSMIEEEMDYYPQPDDFPGSPNTSSSVTTMKSAEQPKSTPSLNFTPYYTVTKYLQRLSQAVMPHSYQYSSTNNATWIGFWAMFLVTCSNYVLMPMRDAIALAVGVEHIPKLTLASTALAFGSSVPIGWLFEAPDPARRSIFKRVGLTRGETQGSSLALFYRFFALSLWSYAIGFLAIELIQQYVLGEEDEGGFIEDENNSSNKATWLVKTSKLVLGHVGKAMYIAFFLVVHLCKLHSLSLVWGVTTETMEYEETARKRALVKEQREQQNNPDRAATANTNGSQEQPPSSKLRLQRLAFVGFGGTVGGILGSILASTLARIFRLSGLLVVSALMLEAAAQLAIELGRIMHAHWMHQQLFPSVDDLASLDPSMKRSASLNSMKRISSGNSLSRVKSMSEFKRNSNRSTDNLSASSSLQSLEQRQRELEEKIRKEEEAASQEDNFSQRLLRGLRTILQSRLLMAIFTYNALYASTTTLLSFQRAELVANRKEHISNEANTAFLANVNMASSVAVFALQASGVGAFIAHKCGPRGTLALMPMVRLMGVLLLAYWHQTSNGEPPNLLLFLLLDECCRVMNMAVAKPVRESLWRGLSNEARYEAKPIVDTLANRWGGGSAAFLVSSIARLLDLFGVPEAKPGEVRVVFGFPPTLFLCMILAAWWAGVSADLGQIRKRIDKELKKMQ